MSDHPDRILYGDESIWRVNAFLVLGLSVGFADGVCFLSLHQIFVANMTGNLVFLGIALAPGVHTKWRLALCALGGLVVGSALGGVLLRRWPHRAVPAVVAAQLLLAAISLLLISLHSLDAAIAALAFSMGLLLITANAIAPKDVSVAVLTMTTVKLFGSPLHRVSSARQLASVVMICGGALAGASLVQVVSTESALAVMLALQVVAWAIILRVGTHQPTPTARTVGL